MENLTYLRGTMTLATEGNKVVSSLIRATLNWTVVSFFFKDISLPQFVYFVFFDGKDDWNYLLGIMCKESTLSDSWHQ